MRTVINQSLPFVWRPSPRLVQLVAALICLATLSVGMSGLTPLARYGAIIGLISWGCVCVWRLRCQRHRQLSIPWHGALPVSVDGDPVHDFSIQWRGSIALLSWTCASGRKERIQCWPDTVLTAQRRELALAGRVRHATLHTLSFRAPWCF